MHTKLILSALLATLTLPALAQTTPAAASQPIEPQVQRREVKLPSYPSRDIAVGAFVGTYATQNFGAATVSGLRIGYHVTEDIFVDATFGQSKVSDEAFRQVLPGGIFVDRSEKLSYYAVSAGWNLLPGEVFLGRSRAKATQGYLVAGIGSTRFAGQRRQTVNVGFGFRLLWNDRLALQADVRDHMFSLDLLGKRQSTQNLEITGGLTLFF
ncbi:MAG: outer membrane beta-barrel domain-containing protein [Rubrivivax sp.]|nr:outer membrane beta-barrel domain-containing protein [Rubrivivax sp.]